MTLQTDVLIVGGGCAGLITADYLCKNSRLKVFLADNKEPGWNNTVRAAEINILLQLGLEKSILRKFNKFIIRSPLGAEASFDYKKDFFASIDYQRLCKELQKRALQNGLIWKTAKVMSFEPNPPRPESPLVVKLEDNSLIQTHILVDASGFQQWAARQLNIQRSSLLSVCYGELLENCNFEEDEYFHLLAQNSRFGKGGGWFYPTVNNAASFGYSIIVPNTQLRKFHPYSGFTKAKKEFKPYSNWVKESNKSHTEGGVIPVGRIGRFYDHHILIVGDSAGQAFPWTVEGVRPALLNGLDCAQIICEAFENGNFSGDFLKSYEMGWKKKYHERFWRSASLADFIWAGEDRDIDLNIKKLNLLSPQKQYDLTFENKVNWFQKAYAFGGYWRRRFVKWLK